MSVFSNPLEGNWQNENKPMLGVHSCSAPCFAKSVPRSRQNLKILGDTIRKYRDQAGLSQEKLAEKADLHPVYIGKIERGEQWISLHALLRVAKALGLRARQLVGDL